MINNKKSSRTGLVQNTARRFFYCLTLVAVFAAWSSVSVSNANGQSFTEGFDVAPPPSWVIQNNSAPVGSTSWSQGSTTVFNSQAGAPTAYMSANFNNTAGTGTISNWIFPPSRTFSNGDVISFYTRVPDASAFPDRLELRLSTNGTSTNVGTTATSVGDFTTLLLSVNPTLTVGGYPDVWTQFTVTISGLTAPTAGRIAFRYFVTSGGPAGDNSNYIGIDTFSYTAATAPPTTTRTKFDFDGDGKADVSVFRGSSANWFVNGSTSGFKAVNFGASTDTIVPGDYDGDGKTDYAVYRPSNFTWYVQRSTGGFLALTYGAAGDIVVPGDYDGDNKTDIAVFRPSSGLWLINKSSTNTILGIKWGVSGDVPVVGDFDGDGKNDTTVIRNNIWYVNGSTAGVSQRAFGTAGDKAVAADYDGDGKTDIAVFRPSNGFWYIQRSTAGFLAQQFGLGTDTPVPADYDGDGKADLAVFRASTGTWYLNRSTAGFSAVPFGIATDIPVPSAYVR